MQKKILLLHGWGGSDFPHWQSWLAGELAKDYGNVYFFKFSDFESPKLDIWMHELKEVLRKFQPEIVICHSLANTLWFHLCQQNSVSLIEKLYLVAPPNMNCKVDAIKEFFPVKAPEKLYAKRTLLITSTNDPYMSVNQAKELQKALNIPMRILQKAGHINSDSGYGKWQWMLREVRGLDISSF